MARECPICHSRKWRRDHVTGSAVCEDGHVYQDFRIENNEADGPSQHHQQRRKVVNTKKKRDGPRHGPNKDYYFGDDAEYLRLQALQVLLRTQVRAVKKLWDLPDVFELIVRDLWTYTLTYADLGPPPSNDPSYLDDEPPSDGPAGEVLNSKEDQSSDEEEEGSDKVDSDQSDKESNTGVDKELLEEMSELSDKSDEREGRSRIRGTRSRRKIAGEVEIHRRITPVYTLAVLVLGLWVIRKGVLCVDIETQCRLNNLSLVNKNIIPYIEFGNTTLFPSEMLPHMNNSILQSLNPRHFPSLKGLWVVMRTLAKRLQIDHNIRIPDANLPIISWRVISALGGTPVTYTQVTRLLDLVNINTAIIPDVLSRIRYKKRSRGKSSRPTSRATSKSRSRARSRNTSSRAPRQPMGDEDVDSDLGSDEEEDEEDEDEDVGLGNEEGSGSEDIDVLRPKRAGDINMPELFVAAGWVVVMKLGYGLDYYIRRAADENDPIVGLPEEKEWTDELEKRLREGTLNEPRRELAPWDFSVMPTDDIDRYLNDAEEFLLKHRELPPGNDAQTFPLPAIPIISPISPPPTSYREFHNNVSLHPSQPPPLIPGTGFPLLPGEKISEYDPKDTTGTYPRSYEIVLRAAAEVIGLEMEDVARVVHKIECRLMGHKSREKIYVGDKAGNWFKHDRRTDTSSNLERRGEFEVGDSDVDSDGWTGVEEVYNDENEFGSEEDESD